MTEPLNIHAKPNYARVFPLSLSAMLTQTSTWLCLPLVALALDAQGYSNTISSVVSALPAAGILAASPVISFLSRQFGTSHAYYAGAALLVVALLMLAAAPHQSGLLLWCAGSFLVGVANALLWILNDAMVNSLSSDATRGRLLAFHETIRSCSLGLGPAFATVFADRPSTAFLIVIGVTFLGVCSTLHLTLPNIKTESAHIRDFAAGMRLVPAPFVIIALCGALEGVSGSNLPLLGVAIGMTAVAAASLAAVSGFGNLGGQLPFGWLADHWGVVNTMRTALFITALSLAAMPFLLKSPALAWGVTFVFGAAGGVLFTLAVVEATAEVRDSIGLIPVLAAMSAFYTVGMLLGPILGGAVLDIAPPAALPATFLALTLATLFFHIRKSRR